MDEDDVKEDDNTISMRRNRTVATVKTLYRRSRGMIQSNNNNDLSTTMYIKRSFHSHIYKSVLPVDQC